MMMMLILLNLFYNSHIISFWCITIYRLEANKVKEVLSANLEYPVKAEQLHDDTDLSTKVS